MFDKTVRNLMRSLKGKSLNSRITYQYFSGECGQTGSFINVLQRKIAKMKDLF